MKRLIDVDALIDKYQNGYSVDVFRYEVVEDLCNAPTIEAIPISFIKERMDGYYKNSYTELGACLETLIEDWRKENEYA